MGLETFLCGIYGFTKDNMGITLKGKWLRFGFVMLYHHSVITLRVFLVGENHQTIVCMR